MPHAYEVIRDRFKTQGMSDKEAKKHAAMIYNGRIAPKTGQPFVTGKSDAPKGSRFKK